MAFVGASALIQSLVISQKLMLAGLAFKAPGPLQFRDFRYQKVAWQRPSHTWAYGPGPEFKQNQLQSEP
jgi:hypothetical protein